MSQNKYNLTFVCTGNTCRSPLAQVIAQNLRPDLNITSAGIFAQNGDGATENAVLVAKEIGLDLSTHSAKTLTEDNSEYYIPMTDSHAQLLIAMGIDNKKIITFKEQIPDPFGCDEDTYRKTRDTLKEQIETLLAEHNL